MYYVSRSSSPVRSFNWIAATAAMNMEHPVIKRTAPTLASSKRTPFNRFETIAPVLPKLVMMPNANDRTTEGNDSLVIASTVFQDEVTQAW
mmetsp:Transcript_18487/g.20911  ORF Transcript_18487/g.20911 Transcript_18487/m.20911 type:complete len:91 (+) Transcript_18487:483-755(+)